MNFRLEPHHLPSDSTASLDAPADAVFSLLWKGSERQIMLRWVRWKPSVFLLFLRVDGELKMAAKSAASNSQTPMKWKRPLPSPRKLLALAHTIEEGQLLLLGHAPFHAANEEPQMVLRQNDGRGVWLDGELEIVGEFAFSLSEEADETQWEKTFFARYAKSSSTARTAWRWPNMNQEERRAWLFDGPDGFDNERRVVHLVLQSADELWAKHEALSWSRTLGEACGDFYDAGWRQINTQRQAPRLARWRRFLNTRLCRPQWNAITQNHFVRDWIVGQYDVGEVEYSMTRPTAHEQLEARLELRDWLEQNVSPQRRRWLLPP